MAVPSLTAPVVPDPGSAEPLRGAPAEEEAPGPAHSCSKELHFQRTPLGSQKPHLGQESGLCYHLCAGLDLQSEGRHSAAPSSDLFPSGPEAPWLPVLRGQCPWALVLQLCPRAGRGNGREGCPAAPSPWPWLRGGNEGAQHLATTPATAAAAHAGNRGSRQGLSVLETAA